MLWPTILILAASGPGTAVPGEPLIEGFEAVHRPLPLEAGWPARGDEAGSRRVLATGLSVSCGRKVYNLPIGDPAEAPDPLAAFAFETIRAAESSDLTAWSDLAVRPADRPKRDWSDAALRNLQVFRDMFRRRLNLPNDTVQLMDVLDVGPHYSLSYTTAQYRNREDEESTAGAAGWSARPAEGGFFRPVKNHFTPSAQAALSAAQGVLKHGFAPLEVAPDTPRVELETGTDRVPQVPVTLNVPVVSIAARSDLPDSNGSEGEGGVTGNILPASVAAPVSFVLDTFRSYRDGNLDQVWDRIGPASRRALSDRYGETLPPDALDSVFADHRREIEVVAAVPHESVTIVWIRETGGPDEWPEQRREPGPLRYLFVEKTADAPTGYRLAALTGVRSLDTVLSSDAVERLIYRAALR